MKITLSPNPVIDSKWFIEKGGKVFLVQIKSTICTGFGDKFKIQSYVLQYAHKEEPQEIEASRLLQLIQEGTLRPDWDAQGRLVPELKQA